MRKSIYFAAPALALCLSAPAMAADNHATTPESSAAEIDPALLGMGREIAAKVWPDGAYGEAFKEMFGGEDMIVDMVLNMTAEDVGMAEDMDPEDAKKTLLEAAREKDPHFEERMRLMMAEMGEIFAELFTPLEPKIREGLARAYAKTLTARQLRDTVAFIRTPSGKAFSEAILPTMMDKEVMFAMMEEMPALMKGMTNIEERLEAATAHLPPPPKDEDEEDEAETAS